MGIKAIKAVEPEANHGILEVDLSEWAGEGAIVRFRQPKAADIFPDGTALKALQIAYPEMNHGMLVNLSIIARCYAFFHLYEAFVDKFLVTNIVAEVDEAKNA
jgi:hypothetical protein